MCLLSFLQGFQGGAVSAWQLDSTVPVAYNFTNTLFHRNSVTNGNKTAVGKGAAMSFFGAGGRFLVDMVNVTCTENKVGM